VVFEALTERNGQLRELIENSNTVFETTAARDRELQETFVALPTFERESRQTVTRLSQFARDTDSLVTQLRPAARELSPTLVDLSALAPDLNALFRDLGPLIDASERGFPAAERVLEDLRPLLAQVDPALRQLNPVLDYLGLYKRELTAFFANTVAATQATTVSNRGPLHYLRTTNPLNPENLAVYQEAPADQPHQPVHAARPLRPDPAGSAVLRDPSLHQRADPDALQRAVAGHAAAATRAVAAGSAAGPGAGRRSRRRAVLVLGEADGRRRPVRVPERRRQPGDRAALQAAAEVRRPGGADAVPAPQAGLVVR
jgi:ABC-type transporter Mla subunit MlaD